MKDYSNAIKIDPGFVDEYFNRGTSEVYLKEYKDAISDFDKTMELKPDFLKAYTNRGIAKLKISDTKGAIDDFGMVLKLTLMTRPLILCVDR